MGAKSTTEEQVVQVYRETIDQLYAYVSRCCYGDRTLAEDVTQEAWLRAVRDWRRKGPPDKPLAWLITVARNLLASYYRRRRPAPLDSVSPAKCSRRSRTAAPPNRQKSRQWSAMRCRACLHPRRNSRGVSFRGSACRADRRRLGSLGAGRRGTAAAGAAAASA